MVNLIMRNKTNAKKTAPGRSFMEGEKRRAFLSCLICRLTMIFLVLASPLSAMSENKAVAKVNGIVLTELDLGDAMNEIIPAAVFHGGITPEKMARYRPQAIEMMIERELFYQEAKSKGMKPDEKKIDGAKEARIENLGGKKRFKNALKQWGITEDEFEKILEKKFLIEDINRAEIDEKASVSDEEARAFYERHRNGYLRPEAVRLRHILVSVSPNAMQEEKAERRRRAEEVLRKARSGEDIAQLAWNYSDDPYRVKGGDFGLVYKGMLDPDLEKEVFKLRTGEIGDIIETIYGYHIVKVEEKKQPELLPYDDAASKIKQELRQKKLKELKEAFVARLRARAKIEIY